MFSRSSGSALWDLHAPSTTGPFDGELGPLRTLSPTPTTGVGSHRDFFDNEDNAVGVVPPSSVTGTDSYSFSSTSVDGFVDDGVCNERRCTVTTK